MLPSTAIKLDAPVSAGTKDKEPANPTLDDAFSAYFSQMMAALPVMQANTPGQAQVDPPSQPAVDSSDRPQKTIPQAQAQPRPQVQAQPQPQVQAQAPAPAPAPDAPGGAGAQAAAGSSGQACAPSSQRAGAAAGSTAQAPQGGDAKPAPSPAAAGGPAISGTTRTAPGPDPAPLAAAAGVQSAAKDQDPQVQALPAKFQVQYDDQAAPATAKAPLTELAAPPATDTKAGSDAQAGNLPDVSLTVQPAAPSAPFSGLEAAAAIQNFQAPLAGQTVLLAPVQAPAGTAGGAGTLSGNVAAAQAVGAGALPGASGAVRVTAPAAAETTLPSGQQSLLSQVDGTIRFLVKNQDQGAELQLHPESLGRIQVKLQVDGTVVHAKVWASEPSALPVLQDHRSFLEASLKSQGLTLGSFDLQQGRRQEQEAAPASAGPAPAPAVSLEASGAGQETPSAAPTPSIYASRIEYVA